MKTYTFILTTILALAMTSCNGFLEENPQNLLPEEIAYNTKEDLLNNAVLMLYNHVGGNADSEGIQGTGRGIYDLNNPCQNPPSYQSPPRVGMMASSVDSGKDCSCTSGV